MGTGTSSVPAEIPVPVGKGHFFGRKELCVEALIHQAQRNKHIFSWLAFRVDSEPTKTFAPDMELEADGTVATLHLTLCTEINTQGNKTSNKSSNRIKQKHRDNRGQYLPFEGSKPKVAPEVSPKHPANANTQLLLKRTLYFSSYNAIIQTLTTSWNINSIKNYNLRLQLQTRCLKKPQQMRKKCSECLENRN